jgi:hypothetical protein
MSVEAHARGAAPGRWIVASMLVLCLCGAAPADDVLHPGTVNVDRPTVVTLGVQLLVTGDDDHNARVAVRYRPSGDPVWRDAMDLFRVHPEDVVGRTVPEQFAGSIFDLTPGATYDVELHATDVDGPVDEIIPVSATLRPVPPDDPANPTIHDVATTADLTAALAAAAPGDVIRLAPGTYTGPFSFAASGTATDPIVIRGVDEDAVVLDGGGCSSCNALEAYGSFVHVEHLTLAHANRALRFQAVGAEGNVVRRVHIWDVRLGIGSNPDQRDFYICDNRVEGRLVWPQVYFDDGGAHSDDDGITVQGSGHVVCHNTIAGFGDALKNLEAGSRALDFYGNEILSAYDNGLELDLTEGNVRCFRNRFTDTFATLSYQPTYGGPSYTLRNVIVNVAYEQLKMQGNGGGTGPNGVLIYHNTFVSPSEHLAEGAVTTALLLDDSIASHHFDIENNLFVGPSVLAGTRTVDWDGAIDDGRFDHDGYFPDGGFRFNLPPTGSMSYPSFAAMQAAGTFEPHGVLLAAPVFANGLVPPSTYEETMSPEDVPLADASPAVDAGVVLPNVNDGFTGSAPDAGAWEVGCPVPLYGVRPDGIDETNEPFGCGGPTVTSTTTTTLPYVDIRCDALRLRDDPANPAKRRIAFKTSTKRDPVPNRVVPPAHGSPGDPTVGGATLTVYDAAGSGEKVVVSLPAASVSAGWSPVGADGYRFRSRDPTIPIASVTVRTDRISLKGGRAAFGYSLAGAPQGRVALRLGLGTSRPWCVDVPAAAGASDDTPARFVGQPHTPPPATCPEVP